MAKQGKHPKIRDLGRTSSTGKIKVSIQIMRVLIHHAKMVRNNSGEYNNVDASKWMDYQIREVVRRYVNTLGIKKENCYFNTSYIISEHAKKSLGHLTKSKIEKGSLWAEKELVKVINTYLVRIGIETKDLL